MLLACSEGLVAMAIAFAPSMVVDAFEALEATDDDALEAMAVVVVVEMAVAVVVEMAVAVVVGMALFEIDK